jgi:class 3 adenylate cyclase
VASLGHRKRLLKAIAALRADAAPQPVERQAVGRPAAGGERRQLTVMFVDLVGSTALSARFDPEELREILRDYQNAVAGEVVRFDGYVAKFMGDGVLAYFGFPEAHEDDPERAVRAGLAVVGAVARRRVPNGEPLACRIGIATGVVVVGELVGDAEARERAVVGESPNLAARLQQLAGPADIVVADGTHRLLGSLFELAALGLHSLHGISEPVHAWRVLGEGTAESRFEALRGDTVGPLIGREEELALLLDRWRLAGTGKGQVVLLSGEPGIGKSRLVVALREHTRDEPRIRLSYACSPHHPIAIYGRSSSSSSGQPALHLATRSSRSLSSSRRGSSERASSRLSRRPFSHRCWGCRSTTAARPAKSRRSSARRARSPRSWLSSRVWLVKSPSC